MTSTATTRRYRVGSITKSVRRRGPRGAANGSGGRERSISIRAVWSATWAVIKFPFQVIAAPVRWIARIGADRKLKKAARHERAEQRRFARMPPRHQAEVLKARSRFGD